MRYCKFVICVGVMLGILLSVPAEAKKLNVVTATTDMAALAQEVGGGDQPSFALRQVQSFGHGWQDRRVDEPADADGARHGDQPADREQPRPGVDAHHRSGLMRAPGISS